MGMGKWRKREGGVQVEEKTVVLVAVGGNKEITDYALEWAVRNVVQPEDTLILLALVSMPPTNIQSAVPQFFSSLFKKWGNGSGQSNNESSVVESGKTMQDDEIGRVNEICAEMMNELCSQNSIKHVQTQVKLVPQSQLGAVADSAEEHQAKWVILDRRLKKESESCLKRLDSNIILIDHAIPKILQLNKRPEIMGEGQTEKSHYKAFDESFSTISSTQSSESLIRSWSSSTVTSLSSSSTVPEKDIRTPSPPAAIISNRELPPSRISHSQQPFKSRPTMDHHHQLYNRPSINYISSLVKDKTNNNTSTTTTLEDTLQKKLNIDINTKNTSTNRPSPPVGSGVLQVEKTKRVNDEEELLKKVNTNRSTSTPPGRRLSVDSRSNLKYKNSSPERSSRTSTINIELGTSRQTWGISRRTFRSDGTMMVQERSSSTMRNRPSTMDRTSSIRRDISLSIKQPHNPPPLCSVCKHAAPMFGKPPRKFSYEEMAKATNGFSSGNYLSEGGFGPVYRGVLEDGQVVAVKKHRKVSAQGAAEFCSEVEVLSCAQHRNLVMLVGYCMDDDWLLVYEFACNGSLDKHLYGIHAKEEVMPWHQRQKVAVGAARGLRYLHEDCRVGCIIHRDLRPNNILLTHDFEPMVGDFGLARWQADGQSAEETRIVGTFGYLAPEYTQTGQITEKADVYAFGVLLLELISGVKAIDLARGNNSLIHNPNENLKEEYQEYLQGLFDEFLHKANGLEYVKARHLSANDSVTPSAKRIF
ncbi:hypothetical protein J5N97_020394 [Dioscorea zingiberensis]|uniref:non-specific serine/threonine protein kinase n=1 Tax=Dioscorea zingiberensis TaxID=325984 RepID=A0A9D5HDM0_9LILI|nr:hypothetical protein J5N97_020394 [Dioscorea zingiberensis]